VVVRDSEQSGEATVAAAYRFCGSRVKPPVSISASADWKAFAAYFAPWAALYPATRPAQPQTVERFVERMTSLAETTLHTFFEAPLGTVVHVSKWKLDEEHSGWWKATVGDAVYWVGEANAEDFDVLFSRLAISTAQSSLPTTS